MYSPSYSDFPAFAGNVRKFTSPATYPRTGWFDKLVDRRRLTEGVYGMLYLTMTFPKHGKNDGILLALSKGQMRIALRGCTDVVELRDVEGQWTRDDGTSVELDGLFTDGNTGVALLSELYPRASAAGQLSEKSTRGAGRIGNT